MPIVGIGIDLIECARVRDVLQRHGDRFMERLLTPAELEYVRAYHKDVVPRMAGELKTVRSDRRCPQIMTRRVIIVIRRSSQNEALRTYHSSSASFSLGEINVPPFTCAHPVRPARTLWRSMYCGIRCLN